MRYKQFDDASYTVLRKNLLRTKGSDEQKAFLNVLRSSDAYSVWMKEQVDIVPGDELPILEENLTEAEFKEPPKSTERQIFEFYESIPPASACRVTFWGFMTLRHIEEGRIQASFLVADGGSLPSGLARIDHVLRAGGSDKEIDATVRTALRRMSGLPEARGNKSVYVNCPFARAWWRRYLEREVCNNTGAKLTAVAKVLRYSQQYWENLIILVVSRNSVVGDGNVRTALIWALSERVNEDEKNPLFRAKALKKIVRLIGVRLAWQELGVFSVEELKELMEELIGNMAGRKSASSRLRRERQRS